MAINIASGNYVDYYPGQPAEPNVLSFFYKTTQTTQVSIVSKSTGTFTGGHALEFVSNSGPLVALGASVSGNQWSIATPGNLNDGTWHHVGANLDYGTTTNGVQLYVDGALVGQATPTGVWGGISHMRLGRSSNAFWGAFVGQIAEVCCWRGGARFTADQMNALAKGFRPPLVARNNLISYIPGIRTIYDILNQRGPITTSGLAVSDHPKMLGKLA